jgi:hypothetical protein
VVVLLLPGLPQHTCLQQVGKLFRVQQLVAHLAVERLRLPVLPRRVRFDVPRLQTRLGRPRPHHPRDKLRPVVRADVLRRVPLPHHPGQDSAHRAPYWLRQRWNVCSLTPSFWQTWPMVSPAAQSNSATRSLGMISSGVCFFLVRLLDPSRALETLISPGPISEEQTSGAERLQRLSHGTIKGDASNCRN